MHSTIAEPRTFVDSNVLVYAVAADAGNKQRKAAAIVERGFAERCYVISTQVLMEVFFNARNKGSRGGGARGSKRRPRAFRTRRWKSRCSYPGGGRP